MHPQSLEEECLKLCRTFCMSVIPVNVLPPAKWAVYNKKRLVNFTDIWLLRRRMVKKDGNMLTQREQRALLLDRTAETSRVLPEVWKLFDLVLVSLHKSLVTHHETNGKTEGAHRQRK